MPRRHTSIEREVIATAARARARRTQAIWGQDHDDIEDEVEERGIEFNVIEVGQEPVLEPVKPASVRHAGNGRGRSASAPPASRTGRSTSWRQPDVASRTHDRRNSERRRRHSVIPIERRASGERRRYAAR